MNKQILILLFFFLANYNSKAQTEDYYQEVDFLSDENYNLVEEMITSFENQICTYYSVDKKESNKAFFKYIQDIRNKAIDVKSLKSEENKKLLKESSEKLLGYIWITNKDKRSNWRLKHFGTNEITIKSSNTRAIKRFQEQLKKTDNNLSINYESRFSDELIEKTYLEDLKDIIYTLKDKPGSDPAYLIASALSNIKEEDYNDPSLKTFIAFELFYTTLNTFQNE